MDPIQPVTPRIPNIPSVERVGHRVDPEQQKREHDQRNELAVPVVLVAIVRIIHPPEE